MKKIEITAVLPFIQTTHGTKLYKKVCNKLIINKNYLLKYINKL